MDSIFTTNISAYGVPHVAYGASHGITESVHLGFPSIDFSWPFALKLNAFTLAKILLKLVIFKMIVKFIAVICLLLFIPKLEIKKTIKKVTMQNNAQDDDDDEDEGRSLQNGNRFSFVLTLKIIIHIIIRATN